jgi:hypothetical protein
MNAIVRWSLTAVVVVGLAIDAFNHFHVAHNYVYNKTSTISEATLFRIEANMYEPSWDVPGKKWTVVGEVIAIIGSAGLLAASSLGARPGSRRHSKV